MQAVCLPLTPISPSFGATIEPQENGNGKVDTETFTSLENDVIYGQLQLFSDYFDVKLLASKQEVHSRPQYDFDGSPEPLVSFDAHFYADDIKTGELQLISNDTSWKSDHLKWVAGYYYFKGLQGLDENFSLGDTVLGGLGSALQPVTDITGTQLTPEQVIRATGMLETVSNSLYFQSTYDFSDWLSLTLGVRAQEEERTIIQSGGSLAIAPQLTGTPQYTDFRGQSDTTKSITPKLSFELRPWEDGLVYLSYQESVKSSTFNVVNFLNFDEPEPVLKEELDAYELGIKTRLFKDTTTVSAALFYYDIRNIQVQFISLMAGGAVTFENAPAAEIKGFDFDITSQIFPSYISGLVATLGGAYLDAKFTDLKEGQGFDEDSGMYSDGNDYSGNRIPRTPEFSGTASLNQTIELPGGPLELAVDYHYNSGYFYLAQNKDLDEEESYSIAGARISYLYEDWDLRITLFGKNILDENYNYSRFTNDFGGLDAAAPPAVYGVRVNWDLYL